MRWMLGVWLVLLIFVCVGCGQPNMEPMERTANNVIDRVVAPMVEKASTEVIARTSTIQGGVQGIEPGWEAQVDGFIVNGFQGRMSIRAKGVAGQLTGHVQADNEAKPASTQPAVEPDPPVSPQ